mmetsp:Transcript_9239/g.30508  ORF Transcript_9239/g.30508 Transcript_9239/m.30508 type:complete len:771 (+) Transcript_9239:118-2430(+)
MSAFNSSIKLKPGYSARVAPLQPIDPRVLSASPANVSSSAELESPTRIGFVKRLELRRLEEEAHFAQKHKPRHEHESASTTFKSLSARVVSVRRSMLAIGEMSAVAQPDQFRASLQHSKWVVSGNHPRMQNWDVTMLLLLLFTSLVTPYEVAFLETRLNALFILNRCVDCAFLVDMILNFFLSYPDSREKIWITDLKLIQRRYLKSWFFIDVISTAPVDLVGIFLQGESSPLRNLRLLRIVRLLRLMKLLRIMRATRIFRRIESSLPVNYAMFALIKFVLFAAILGHLLACTWQLVSDFHPNPDETWAAYYAESFPDSVKDAPSRYITCFYWALTTMSTIGYGDIIPYNTSERCFACFAQLFGASLYAYVVGAVCGIISGMDERSAIFYETMDSLNRFIDEQEIPLGLAMRLRNFIRYRRTQNSIQQWETLLENFSPSLQAEIAVHSFSWLIKRVPVLSHSTDSFVEAYAMQLTQLSYSPMESVIKTADFPTKLYLVYRGFVASEGRLYGMGSLVGENIIYRPHVAYGYSARSLGFVEVFVIEEGALFDIFNQFPECYEDARHLAIKRVFIHNILAYHHACKVIEGSAKGMDLLSWKGHLVALYIRKLQKLNFKTHEERRKIEGAISMINKHVRALLAKKTVKRLLEHRKRELGRREHEQRNTEEITRLRALTGRASDALSAAPGPQNASEAALAEARLSTALVTQLTLRVDNRFKKLEAQMEFLVSSARAWAGPEPGGLGHEQHTSLKRARMGGFLKTARFVSTNGRAG